MNISKQEQRVLHTLAMGGEIRHYLDEDGKLTEITCFTREGYGLSNCTMDVFRKLKRKKMISSKSGQPYRITHLGATFVQAQMNQR
ncbi:YjhX family toxin [Photobacterium kasasachensis]|uniref:YjhX family toxin n=1 Tax=Photobacterium kasasachensis TaxID=2910240 RepID=UPI003D0DDAC3